MPTGKKFSKTVRNPKTGRKKTVRYGAKGYSIAPGTKRGDSYCARSLGIKKRLSKKKQNDPNSPNNLSRRKWKCSGAKSRRKWCQTSEVKNTLTPKKELQTLRKPWVKVVSDVWWLKRNFVGANSELRRPENTLQQRPEQVRHNHKPNDYIYWPGDCSYSTAAPHSDAGETDNVHNQLTNSIRRTT